MKWSVYVRPRAERDIQEARAWYEERKSGLGDSLINEVTRAIRALEKDADRFPIYYREFRRVLLPRFPYKIFYLLEGESVIVFRFLHAKREHRFLHPPSNQGRRSGN